MVFQNLTREKKVSCELLDVSYELATVKCL
jgi:hypothetical protein